MTVEELLKRISSRELTEWMAYYGLDPFGEERADLRAGIVASTMANIWRDKKQEPYKPQDFMLSHNTKAEMDWETQLAYVEMLNTAFGGQDLREK